MRQLSRELDNNPLPDAEAGRKYIFKNTVWAAMFIVWFALTVMSVTLVLANEYRCTLVFYHVQLVHIRQHICERYGLDHHLCGLT